MTRHDRLALLTAGLALGTAGPAAAQAVLWSGAPTGRTRPRRPTPSPTDAGLPDLLAEWAPDPAARDRILVSNPPRLYGF